VKAVDTNVLARLVLQDDPVQLPLARTYIAQGVWVPATVLLELGWLLKSRYQFSRNGVAKALETLLDHPRISFADEDGMRTALGLFRQGGDFADLVHLVEARGSEAFGTFDCDVPDGTAIGVPVEIVGR
jgi:predicted nucleic-acid-binding protein